MYLSVRLSRNRAYHPCQLSYSEGFFFRLTCFTSLPTSIPRTWRPAVDVWGLAMSVLTLAIIPRPTWCRASQASTTRPTLRSSATRWVQTMAPTSGPRSVQKLSTLLTCHRFPAMGRRLTVSTLMVFIYSSTWMATPRGQGMSSSPWSRHLFR